MKNILTIVKLLFLVFAIFFFFAIAWTKSSSLNAILENAIITLFVLSIIIWILLHLLTPLFTTVMLRGIKEIIGYIDALRIHTGRLPAKYLPGGIWHSVARVEGYHSAGVSSKGIIIYLLIENLLSPGITLSFGGAISLYYFQGKSSLSILIGFIMLVSLCVVFAIPFFINKKFFNGKTDSRLFIDFFLAGIIAIIFWLGASLSFLCFIKALPGSSIVTGELHLMGVYLFSWGIGFITLFAPQGIGISEYVSTLLLEHGIDAATLLVVLAGFRLVVLCADLITWAGYLLISLLPAYVKIWLED